MIIGLRGGKGAGKTSAARYLAETYNAREYACADELKALAELAYDLRPEQLHGSQVEKERIDPATELSGRRAMTRLGKAFRDVFGPTVWIDRVLARIADERPAIAVISDVRFIAEAERIRDAGGLLWRLHYAPGLDPGPATDESEAEWTRGDIDLELIPGAGGLLELYELLDSAIEKLDLHHQIPIANNSTSVMNNLCTKAM